MKDVKEATFNKNQFPVTVKKALLNPSLYKSLVCYVYWERRNHSRDNFSSRTIIVVALSFAERLPASALGKVNIY